MAVRKKATRKKATRKAATGAAKKALTKTEIYTHLSEQTELSKRDVKGIFDELTTLAGKHLGSRGPGQFTIPGLCKMTVKVRPARKARKGVNPFTGEEMTFKAKPKSKTVKIRPVKALKDMVS